MDKDKLYKLEAVLEDKTVNWERVYELARIHQIRPLLLRGVSQLKNADIPAYVMQQLKQDCMFIAASNLRNTQEMLRLLTLYKENGITAVPYKGAYLANTYYGDFGMREFGDIDLLIYKDDFQSVKKIMLAQGYKTEYEFSTWEENWAFLNSELNYQYRKDNVNFHVEPHYRSNNAIYGFLLTLKELEDCIIPYKLEQNDIHVLSPSGTLLLSTTNHGVNEAWGTLKYIFDIYLMLVRYEKKLDWDWIIKESKKIGIEKILLSGIGLVKTIFEIAPNTIFNDKIKDEGIHNLVLDRLSSLEAFEDMKYNNILISRLVFNLKSRSSIISRLKIIFKFFISPTNDDVLKLKLPSSLFFIYYFYSPLNRIKKYFSNNL